LFMHGGLRDGGRGLHYAVERTLVELLLSWALIKRRLRAGFVFQPVPAPAAKG